LHNAAKKSTTIAELHHTVNTNLPLPAISEQEETNEEFTGWPGPSRTVKLLEAAHAKNPGQFVKLLRDLKPAHIVEECNADPRLKQACIEYLTQIASAAKKGHQAVNDAIREKVTLTEAEKELLAFAGNSNGPLPTQAE